jgi:DNA-binding XRE family transcriptional regulator
MNYQKKIKGLRDHFNKSQTEFAKEIGVSRGSICQIEIGKHKPTLELVTRIVEVYKIDVHYFFIEGYPIKPFTSETIGELKEINILAEVNEEKELRTDIERCLSDILKLKEKVIEFEEKTNAQKPETPKKGKQSI